MQKKLLIKYPFTIKILSKEGIEGACLNIIKAMYEKPTDLILENPHQDS